MLDSIIIYSIIAWIVGFGFGSSIYTELVCELEVREYFDYTSAAICLVIVLAAPITIPFIIGMRINEA